MKDKLEATLAQLIAIPSTSNNADACHDIINYIKRELEAIDGLSITTDMTLDNPWLIATTQPTKTPDLMLAAHLDVVPAAPEAFTLTKRDGRYLGRGVYDMKMAAACYLELIRAHADEFKQRNLALLFTTDEEIGGNCMNAILADGWRPQLVFIPDGGGDWKIEEMAKGMRGVELTATGIAAHGSRPWEGDNAIHRLAEALTELRQAFPYKDTDDTTLSVNYIKGGEAVNQIASHAAAGIDVRSFDQAELVRFDTELEQQASKYNLVAQIMQTGAPVIFNKSLPQVQRFLSALAALTGKEAEFVRSYGASDARYFAEYNIPCLIMQPHGGGRHAAEEWLLIDDLERYYNLVEDWVLSYPTYS